jgi:hypothetical protein
VLPTVCVFFTKTRSSVSGSKFGMGPRRRGHSSGCRDCLFSSEHRCRWNPPITWTLYTGIVRPGLWCVQGCIVQTFLRSGLVSFRSRGRWLIFGVVGQAHMRLWLCQDRWHSRSRGPCTLPWALPCLRVLVAVSSVTSRATKPIHNRRKLCHSPDHSTNSTCHTPP